MSNRKGQDPGLRRAGAALLLALAASTAACASAPARPAEREVLLGGLFSLTGPWSVAGQDARAAMELAVEDVNRYLAGNAAGVRFVAVIEDTRLDGARALEQARALHARGVQLLIGPQSSAEVERVKPFVDASGMLLVSQSSTAGTLTIPGDNVFRFTPSDSLEGVAIAAVMWDDGVRAVVPVWRDDAGNAGLAQATRRQFTALGGTVLEGVRYAADTGGFDDVLARLDAQLATAVARHGADRVAVYLAAFDEAVTLFEAACEHPGANAVRWYGSDGVARNEALLASAQAADFAIRTGYPSPAFGVDQGARELWQPLARRIRERTGREPDAFALAAHDAVWAVARGYIASGATRDVETLKRAFTTAAATGYGATGWTVLNEAGDRRHGDFDLWAVRTVSGAPQWLRVARYESRTGLIVRGPFPSDGAAAGAARADGGPATQSAFGVEGALALHALTALSDAHLQKTADVLALLAATDAARSLDWERVRDPLADAARRIVPGVHWFALPDGTYWTLGEGRVATGLGDRPYFPRLLAGESVLGELVVSRSTGRNAAIVAVPVRAPDGRVIGALGSSVHLDSLTLLLREEIGGLDPGHLFFALGPGGLGALNSDASLIFTRPLELGDDSMRRAFAEILAGTEGIVNYDFRGGNRTVLYRRSPITGWWYGFGMIRE